MYYSVFNRNVTFKFLPDLLNMKYIFLVVLLVFTLPTLGQSKPHSFSVGIRMGTSLSSFVGAKSPFAKMDYQPDTKAGFMAGVLVEYTITRHFAVQTGINYEEKGVNVNAKRTIRNEYSMYESQFIREVDNDYFSLPVLFRWQSTGKLYWSAGAGGFLALLQKSRIYGMQYEWRKNFNPSPNTIGGYLHSPSGSHSTFRDDGKYRTHKLDYGLVLGTGIHYGITSHIKLSLDTQLQLGLRKIDSQYNNDRQVSVLGIAGYETFSYDYYNLSSKAKNVNLLINMGLSWRVK